MTARDASPSEARRRFFGRLAAVLVLMLGIGCSHQRETFTGPSPQAVLPQLGGSYRFTLESCQLSMGNEIERTAPIGPYQSIWTVRQEGALVRGEFSAKTPRDVSSGSLLARVDDFGAIVIEDLQFSWSSSPVYAVHFRGAGEGNATKTEVSGGVSGEKSFMAAYGGPTGTQFRCTGSGMPFKFTRQNSAVH